MRIIDATKVNWETCPVRGYAIKEWLAEQPTINPESLRPKGEWIDKMVRDWHCSECGESVPKQVRFDGYCYDDKLNFCPNCGADMRGGEANEKDTHLVQARI